MRTLIITIACPEREAGSLLADLADRKGVEVRSWGVEAKLPVANNRPRANTKSVTVAEILMRMFSKIDHGVTYGEMEKETAKFGFGKGANTWTLNKWKTQKLIRKDGNGLYHATDCKPRVT